MSETFNVQKNFPLAPLTTFKIGGNARFFIEAQSDKEIVDSLKFAEEEKIDVFVLGGGSNILISDEGFDGLVLKIASKGISFSAVDNGKVLVSAQAGEDWDEFVAFCIEKNLGGIECLSGIPGLVGGTPIQNVGAYGQEVSETIKSVRVYNRQSKKTEEFSNEDCEFEYRKSIFNSTRKNRFIVLSVIYELTLNGSPNIVYADLKKHFTDTEPTLAETRNVVRKIRRSKGMLVRQGGLDSQSAGSFFKNPIVADEKYREICLVAADLGIVSTGGVPNYRIDENFVKIPAAWLIEKSGFQKGYLKGNAGLSTCHTLALTNRGNATAGEIIVLKADIQDEIKRIFGVDLIPEPNFVGFKN